YPIDISVIIYASCMQGELKYYPENISYYLYLPAKNGETSVKEYAPNHSMADEEGYIFRPNVNMVEEMANMISASRSYQSNVEVASAAKQMLIATIRMGQ
ncbi:MAG: flagellar basal body rod protein FlgC, partial [gamma proteobacterium endosymbiont of Lamellibrachia anaximandri]|nr:flagellar basal body rod protein FlgC [gamma proteobacterium endosymbiont of Lamellibrachia anaximandri]